MRVQVLSHYDNAVLEDKVNMAIEALEKHHRIIDVKFSVAAAAGNMIITQFSAMIMYEPA